MDFTITWPVALTIIGSVGTICLTIWRILRTGNGKPSLDTKEDLKAIRDKLTEARKERAESIKELAVLNAQFADHKEDDKEEFGKVREQIRDLSRIIHELLCKLKL